METEKRLIDANVLNNEIRGRIGALLGFQGSIDAVNYFEHFQKMVDNAPTVDAVEVVRCKDCKHWLHLEDGIGDCTNGRFHIHGVADITMNAEEFCCLGEMRADD